MNAHRAVIARCCWTTAVALVLAWLLLVAPCLGELHLDLLNWPGECR